MMRVCAGMVAAALLASCRESPPPPPEPTPTVSATATASATPEPSGARSVAEETDDFLFEYAYPAEAGNIPALAILLDARLTRARASLAREAAEGRAAARDNGFPFNKYSTGITWAVVTDTPRFLSLSAQITSYTGGAHGNAGFDALVWDREADKALKPEEFFTSIEALDDAIGTRLCDMLQRERSARRGGEKLGGQFDDCVKLADTTLLLGSSNGRAFNRLGVMMGPYVAGPYAEGTYEFTVPVDAKVIATVKEEYRSAFAPSRNSGA
ncbi:PdaC/SigV domain-containing protein [Altererythrobacter lauratis]|uniref:PdaC/SigV domain-containing protein n=1 Tax=Alteraurantiacibacter lauratis TaxID=2054627 RepID=A0ABV7EHA4_9SPHN